MSSGIRPRIAMYSHDTMGLGHVRRNILIAQALAKSNLEPNILLLSGAQEADNFVLPERVDRVILPSLYKEKDGQYRSRLLQLPLTEIVNIRRKILQSAVSAFNPHLMIVDCVPRGAVGELDLTLEHLRSQGHTSCVLGMRDIWDEPEAIAREWRARNNFDAIKKYYDEVWIYGDQSVYDPVKEYSIEPEIANKIKYTGYLNQVPRLELVTDNRDSHPGYSISLPKGEFALCMVGGGQDGFDLAKAFVDADLPNDIESILITGPYMEPNLKKELLLHAQFKKHVKIYDFVPEPNVILQKALCVISMGGYNTVCAIMSFAKNALVVPRVTPRKEQLIRAERLASQNILKIVHPDNLTSAEISKFVQNSTGSKPTVARIDMDGLLRVGSFAESLLKEQQFCISDCQAGSAI